MSGFVKLSKKEDKYIFYFGLNPESLEYCEINNLIWDDKEFNTYEEAYKHAEQNYIGSSLCFINGIKQQMIFKDYVKI